MELARDFIENSIGNSLPGSINHPTLDSQEGTNQMEPHNSSSYTLAYDHSQLSRDVDRWVRGNSTSIESTGVQGGRIPVMQRSTLTVHSSRLSTGVWYILALMLPMFNFNHNSSWRCSPSTILNTAELLVTHVGRICNRVRCYIRRLAQSEISRELCATAMDVVLVVYAIGFLILSMYQAAIIG